MSDFNINLTGNVQSLPLPEVAKVTLAGHKRAMSIGFEGLPENVIDALAQEWLERLYKKANRKNRWAVAKK